jgi:hypothetical protein
MDQRGLVTQSLACVPRYRALLQECMEHAGIDKKQLNYKPWLIIVLVYELLLGNRKITGGGAGPRLVKEHKQKLTEALASILQRHGASCAMELLPESERQSMALPKYARVNTFKSSVDEVVQTLAAAGWQETGYETFLQAIDADAKRFQRSVPNARLSATPRENAEKVPTVPTSRVFARDSHLDDVLLFPPGALLKHDDPLLTSCQLRLQDKARSIRISCPVLLCSSASQLSASGNACFQSFLFSVKWRVNAPGGRVMRCDYPLYLM